MVMFSDDLVNRLIRYPRAIASRIRIMRLRMCGVRFGRKCWIRRIHVPRNPWDIVIDDMVALDDEVVLLTTGARKREASTASLAEALMSIGLRCSMHP